MSVVGGFDESASDATAGSPDGRVAAESVPASTVG